MISIALASVYLLIANLLYLIATAGLGTWFGIHWHEVALGLPPYVVRTTIRGRDVKLGVVPMTAYVRFDEDSYGTAPAWRKAIILASAIAVFLGVGALISPIPIDRVACALARGLMHPMTHGAASFAALISQASLDPVSGLGIVLILLGLINLLPIGATNGGQLLSLYLAPRMSAGIATAYRIAGVAVALLIASSALVIVMKGWAA